MKKLLVQLWSDDTGALISAEYLFVATILVIGLVVGLASLRGAITAELAELANAFLALNQSYSIGGLIGCCAEVGGSQAIDSPQLVAEPTCTTPTEFSVIDVLSCN